MEIFTLLENLEEIIECLSKEYECDYNVKCINPVKAITSGQEAVFYYNGECLGGGVIDKVYRNGNLLDC